MDSRAYDLIVVGPHPDDAEIGCGGALSQAAAAGARAGVVDLTAGERASRGTPAGRLAERDAASAILGLTGRFDLAWPDSGIVVSPEARDQLARVFRRLRPRIVLAPHWRDRHPDHAAAGRLAREACFAAGLTIPTDEPPFRPEAIFHYMLHSPFDPTFVLDISDQWATKQAAIHAYASQFGDAPGLTTALSGPGFRGMLEARAAYFGAMIGVQFGEPYLHLGPMARKQMPGTAGPPRAVGTLPPYTPF